MNVINLVSTDRTSSTCNLSGRKCFDIRLEISGHIVLWNHLSELGLDRLEGWREQTCGQKDGGIWQTHNVLICKNFKNSESVGHCAVVNLNNKEIVRWFNHPFCNQFMSDAQTTGTTDVWEAAVLSHHDIPIYSFICLNPPLRTPAYKNDSDHYAFLGITSKINPLSLISLFW